MLIILIANYTPAIENSTINNEVFNNVFGLSPIAVLASSSLIYLLNLLIFVFFIFGNEKQTVNIYG